MKSVCRAELIHALKGETPPVQMLLMFSINMLLFLNSTPLPAYI